ncbi:MAG TPA: HAMP domain-containing sensor histidine kinase [Allosphingosinicella sp.]|jgi:signal transduction histidine kinase
MLRRTPSLALRAVLTFTAVYIAAIAVFLTIIVVTDDPDRDRNSHTGPKIALSRAAEDLVPTETGFRLARDGGFADMASRNPAIWLIGRSGDSSFSFGPVPQPVARALDQHGLFMESGRFYVPGVERPLANAVVERRRVGSGIVLLAVGGVDPKTLGSGDSLGASWGEGVLVILFWIAVVGFAAMLIALPILSRALRPLAAEAASILPREPARRLDEEKAPRELLPLVRGFNAALDRLASELGRQRRFIADAAHELRTPLAVVSLRVEALADETDRQELRRGLGRLVHLVSQMLDIERLSLSGRERSPADLAAIARDVVADLAPTAIKSGYDLSLEAPDEPVMVTGDAHAISRAVTNLIGNSVAHGGGAGQIRVAVGADRTIEVTDEGPGVPAALQPRLFEPFSRGSSSAEGCGLGLHLTREIMRAHGGEVALVPGRGGAAFRLSFAPPHDEIGAFGKAGSGPDPKAA